MVDGLLDGSGRGMLPKKGPPNRMNDLSYTDWMRFQKSFFRFVSTQKLVEECICFFTKSVWSDGSPSVSLVVGSGGFDTAAISAPRVVHSYPHLDTVDGIVSTMQQLVLEGRKYDFVLVDLQDQIRDTESVSDFLRKHSHTLFSALRTMLTPDRYCAILVGTHKRGGVGFPSAWAIGDSSRSYLRLRDEKVGIVEGDSRIVHCLLMQGQDDQRSPTIISPDTMHIDYTTVDIPAWVMPRSPPRKRNEILHPAKFPETLITDFIEMFTEEGDSVFDPMVGTGSAVVAAIKSNRRGYGMDLILGFVEIARRRALEAMSPTMFSEVQPLSSFEVVHGDASRLDDIEEFSRLRVDYVVTSPPYWSVLSNIGSEGQRSRRTKGLPLTYSDDTRDLSNIADYDRFLDALERIYVLVADKIKDNGCLTVIVKNVKRHHIVYPLAWDISARLCRDGGRYDYIGTTLWCQDDISIKPFAVGIHWVSNVLHQYCLHFRRRR